MNGVRNGLRTTPAMGVEGRMEVPGKDTKEEWLKAKEFQIVSCLGESAKVEKGHSYVCVCVCVFCFLFWCWG